MARGYDVAPIFPYGCPTKTPHSALAIPLVVAACFATTDLWAFDESAIVACLIAIAWSGSACRRFGLGAKSRALIAVTLALLVVAGLLVGSHVRRARIASEADRMKHEITCQVQVGVLKTRTAMQEYPFDACTSVLTHEQAIAFCRPRIFKRGPLPDGWSGCSEYEAEILAYPR